MSTSAELERIDTLLALTLAFGQSKQDDAQEERDDAEEAGTRMPQLQVLSVLGDADRRAVERRAQWYAKLGRDKQASWLARMLARSRAKLAHLDEHIHPSHILEELRDEPPRIQALILRHLPPALAASCATALDLELPVTPEGRHAPAPIESVAGGGRGPEVRDADPVDVAPAPEIVDLVRRTFLSHFVAANEINNPTHLDVLSGLELARLVRLLGVHETAIACRGVNRAEAVGSFLRRFAAEDARAIATHMATLISVEPQRIALAEQLVHEALSLEPEPGAMLDRLGMQVLAVALAVREAAAVRAAYITQKLPVEAARELREMVAAGSHRYDHEMTRLVARETEALALSLRRMKAKTRPPAASSTNSVAPHSVEIKP